MGPEDRAKCWHYGPELSRWAAGGSPPGGHRRPCSLCGHILSQNFGRPLSWGGQDRTDGQILGQLHPLAEDEEEERVRATPSPRPAVPEMGSEELRLASFCNWPLMATVRPEPLAAAGFFHKGQQDKVRCFFCYGGLQSWEQGDDPWTEHAKWFPRCEFLLRTKGRDFVSSIQESCFHLLDSWGTGIVWLVSGPMGELEDAAAATPSAAVHPDPEPPSSRRETPSEGAREPGAQSTEDQLQRLREEQTCKVCLDRAVSIVFVPCGHLVCAECAPKLQLCPICRAPIHSCVRTFLA
ncbi:LOW QUALITY PROTEIN: baculoviral IAP repeat-containing protein 7 [Rhynchonycteris naso]